MFETETSWHHCIHCNTASAGRSELVQQLQPFRLTSSFTLTHFSCVLMLDAQASEREDIVLSPQSHEHVDEAAPARFFFIAYFINAS